jgi:hypothetical protein
MTPLCKEVKKWVGEKSDSISRNRWFEDKDIKVYLRYFNYSGRKQIDLSNITVVEEKRGQCLYSRFLGFLMGVCTAENFNYLKIENVLEDRFQKFHEKLFKGEGILYEKKLDGLGATPSYYIRLKQEQ